MARQIALVDLESGQVELQTEEGYQSIEEALSKFSDSQCAERLRNETKLREVALASLLLRY